jgi:hypothetical protein
LLGGNGFSVWNYGLLAHSDRPLAKGFAVEGRFRRGASQEEETGGANNEHKQ